VAKRLGRFLARGAALSVSIGIFAWLMVRASVGCSNRTDIGADQAGSTAEPTGAAATTMTPSSSASAKPRYGVYFPGTKADPHVARTSRAQPLPSARP
jgi:hypothetical protein